MQSFEIEKLVAEQAKSGRAWLEFLRVPSLSMGVYHLQAGQPDPQKPHTEDEVYYVVAGRGWFRAGAAAQAVGPGRLIFVEKQLEHRFFDVSEDLTVLVFFAPAEGSGANASS
ncbi:MAG: cupin domain-containing protein [Planctomycetes bacterium]|nr:cupin domain-containing protein [Planctomycetota bacterium]